MATVSYPHRHMNSTSAQGYVSTLLPEDTLIREVTALAKAEHRRHRLACAHTSITVDDLISEGWLAAQKALRNFDPEKGELLHYLRRYVKRELAEAVRSAKFAAVSVSPRTAKRMVRGELAPETVATLTAFQRSEGIAVGNRPDETEGEPEQGMVYETDMNVEAEDSVEDTVLRREQAEVIHQLVEELAKVNPLNARVVRLRFGMEDGIAYSVEEVAAIMGTGTKNVERRYTAAMKTLRQLTEPLSLSVD